MTTKKSSSSVRGIYSSKTNPLPKARSVARGVGPSSNKDSMKANKLLHKAYTEKESLRGVGC